MSFLSKVFGGKKDGKAPTTGEAIQKLRETEEMLIKKQEFLEKKIEQEIGVAKKNGTKNKRAAIQALKRKKRYEKQLQQIDGTLSTIEMQREALEGANTNTAVLQTMKSAADALKAAHQHMDVDKVHDMMDDIAEQQDVAREISDAISNPVAFGQDIDEDELERELEELEQEELDKELLGVGPTAADELPSPPTALPAVAIEKKTTPKEELDAAAAMRSPALAALLLLMVSQLAPPAAGFDFWKRHFGFEASDILKQVEHGFQEMEKSAKEEAHTLEQSLRGLLGRTPAGSAAAPAAGSVESLEDHDEDDDDDDEPDIDEATGLESGFGDSFFGMFGPARQPWWKGPNVCVEREEIDESTHRNNSKGEDGDDAAAIFGSFHFSSCQQTPISYVCRTKMNSHGIRKTFIVKYQCCYGHQRVEGKPGCVEVHMKPLMDTLEDVGARDFVELVRSSGLDEKVRESNMTIFAPSDDAIRDFTDSFQEANQVEFYSTITQRRKRETNIKEDNLSMRKIVLGHMTPGFYDINEIVNKNEVFTENNNSSIRLNVYPAPGERIITANCARVTSINNYATNGIVHVVDRVLQPVTQSLAQLIAQDEQFTTLESMLSKAGLLKQLAEPGHWTLFAFTDSAFQKLDANIRKRLTDADTCITNVVRHHLVPHTLCSAPIVTHATTLNLDGEPLSLERRPEDGKLFVNKVQIVAKDIMATNGIIHVVDDVLMPDSGQPLSHVLGAHNLTTFRSLLEEAGLSEALDSTSNVTLFVPSEEALSQPEAVAELDKRRGDPAALRDLLLFHSTGPAVKGCDLGSSRHELKSGLADHSLRLGYYSSWPFLSSAVPGRATVECARVTHFDSRACGGVVHEVDRLLVPPENSVLEKLRNLGNYSILLRLIENANLENELKQNAPLTILAPPDSVFEQLDPVDLQLLHNDTQLAARIIKHHILPEMLCCTGIGASSWLFVNRVETLDGHYVAVRRDSDDNVHIGTTTVRQCDIMATDGIIHSVNRIMVPMRRKNSRNKNPNVDVFLYGL